MGFPVGYTELMLPNVLLRVIFFLGYIRRFITWAFDVVGLGDLLDSTDIPTWPDHHDAFRHVHGHSHVARHGKPFYAAVIQDALPVVKYEPLAGVDDSESCAVCLHEFAAGEDVRRLSNCRHVFHRCCLDPWVEFDQRTCPLCRTPLVPDELDRKLRGEAEASGERDSLYYGDFYDSDDYYYSRLVDDSFGGVDPFLAQPFVWPSTASAPL